MTPSARFTCYPRTEPPPQFIHDIVEVFASARRRFAPSVLRKGSPATRC
jgi:hypothetical protein